MATPPSSTSSRSHTTISTDDHKSSASENSVTRTHQVATEQQGSFLSQIWTKIFSSFFSSHTVTPVAPPQVPTPIHIEREPQPALELQKLQENIQQQLARLEFPPYQLTVKFPSGPKTYLINNKQEEAEVIRELEQWFLKNYESLPIEDGISSEDFCQIVGGQYARIRKIFADHFVLSKPAHEIQESLNPKPIAQENLGDDRIRLYYTSGIREQQRLKQGKWELESRIYPNGDVEKGAFSAGKLSQGYRCSQEGYTFLYPDKFFINSTYLELSGYNFTEAEIDGKTQLVLIERNGLSYRLSQKPPLPILFQAAKKAPFYSSYLKQILSSPLNPISPKALVEYALTLDDNDEFPIFSLNENDVLSVLTQAKMLNIPLLPATLSNLFAKSAEKNWTDVTQFLLEIDPTFIDQTKKEQVSFFRKALQKGYERDADIWKKAMLARNIPLSQEDLWVEKIQLGDNSFSDADFQNLSPSFQKELYQEAHVYAHEHLVARMNGLGMKQLAIAPQGPTPLSPNMDLTTQQAAIHSYLKELRHNHRLLLPEEAPKNLASFHCNKDDFSRIPGADFVKKTVQRLGLKHIDAAETFGVLKEGISTLHIELDHGLFLQSKDLDIYAEKIIPVERFISLEEAFELLDAIEDTGFCDIHPSNFIVTENKIYFCDLESTNFQKHTGYHLMGSLLSLVKPEDQEALWESINTRTEARQKWAEEHEQETKKQWEQENLSYFFYRRGKPFAFPVGSLL